MTEDKEAARDMFVVTLTSAMLLWERKGMTIGQLADWIIGAMAHYGYAIKKETK